MGVRILLPLPVGRLAGVARRRASVVIPAAAAIGVFTGLLDVYKRQIFSWRASRKVWTLSRWRLLSGEPLAWFRSTTSMCGLFHRNQLR